MTYEISDQWNRLVLLILAICVSYLDRRGGRHAVGKTLLHYCTATRDTIGSTKEVCLCDWRSSPPPGIRRWGSRSLDGGWMRINVSTCDFPVPAVSTCSGERCALVSSRAFINPYQASLTGCREQQIIFGMLGAGAKIHRNWRWWSPKATLLEKHGVWWS